MIFFSGRFLGKTHGLGDIEGLEGLPLGKHEGCLVDGLPEGCCEVCGVIVDDKVAETEGGGVCVDLGHLGLWDCVDCCGRHLGGSGDGLRLWHV